MIKIAVQVLTGNYTMPEMKEETFAQLLLSILILPRPAQGSQIVSPRVQLKGNPKIFATKESFGFQFGNPFAKCKKMFIILYICPNSIGPDLIGELMRK